VTELGGEGGGGVGLPLSVCHTYFVNGQYAILKDAIPREPETRINLGPDLQRALMVHSP